MKWTTSSRSRTNMAPSLTLNPYMKKISATRKSRKTISETPIPKLNALSFDPNS